MSQPATVPRYYQNGAALLLMIVLLGLGAATLIMKNVRPLDDSARQLRTALQIAEAKEALIGYAMTHGRLPRPAISAEDGREMPATCSQDRCTGLLPWVTLGITGGDAWGKMLRYSVSVGFAQRIVPSKAMADKRILTRDNSGEAYYVVGNERCDMGIRCAPAVIYSNGKDNFGISTTGTQLRNGSISNIDEQQNDSSSDRFFARRKETRSQVDGGEFDDIVAWIPLQLLYRRLEVSGAINNN